MKFKFNMQNGLKDCGATVLYNIILYYGGNIDFEELRAMTNTNKFGTSVYDIVNTSNKLGIISNGYRCSLDSLQKQIFPLVLHLNVDNKYPHFVILKKIKNNIFYIFDPIRGNIKYTKEKLINEWDNIIITFKKTEKIIKNNIRSKNIVFDLLNKKTIIIFLIFLSITSTIFSSINSFYIKELIDTKNNKNLVLIFFLLISLINLIIVFIKNKLIINFSTNLESKLHNKFYNHIINLPIKYHHNRPAGDVLSRMYDLYYIKDFINQFLYSMIIDIFLLVISLILLFLINKLLFLFSFIIVLIYISIYYIFRKKINQYLLINQENESKVNSDLIEDLLGIDTIKNLNKEDEFKSKHYKIYNEHLRNNKKLNNIYNCFNQLQEFVHLIGIILIIFIGNMYVNNHLLTLGSLIAFYSILLNIFSILSNIFNYDNLLLNSKNAYKRINELLNVKNEFESNCINKFDNKIEFKKLCYSYKNLKILKNFSLLINKNDKVLVTGPSGIGKSTLFKLLTKQLSCDPNMILLDDKPINTISNNYIKNKICYISQNEFIFTDSIKNNITLYNNSYKSSDINKVLKITMIDEMLKKKNIDINYILEENGHNLSGGERQKIIIARALLSNKDILIFDETMNEIDIKSERKILKNIITEYKKTLILISHRISNKDLFNKCVQL